MCMVGHSCNPSTREAEAAEAGDLRFKASLGYRVRSSLKKTLCNSKVFERISIFQME
jgi:hypothetical protein